MKCVKVLQLGNPTGLYGAERWILALIKYLDQKKVESWVATIKDALHLEGSLCCEAERCGFPTHMFDCYGKFNLSAISMLRDFIKQNSINILHTHGYKNDLIGFVATRGTNCKIVSTPHGWTQKPDLKLWCYEMLNRLIFPFFDAVVPLSDDLYNQICSIPGTRRRVHFIMNGVDINEINNVKNIDSQLLSMKKNGAVIIGYIGRLTHGKGLETLFKAVAQFGLPSWHVILIGEGEQLNELESMAQKLGIREQVFFLGFRQDRISCLKGFDVFVLPSRSEGIPRCLMESMTAGVPVVASDIPGCRQLVDDNKTGLLFNPNNPKQLADSIKKIISDNRLREYICSNGKELIQSKFSAAIMAKKYEELFFTLADKIH